MLESFIYLFAAYGLLCLLYFNLKEYIRPRAKPSAMPAGDTFYLVIRVNNAEDKIEGLVKECVKLAWKLGMDHRLVVVDTGSTDQTPAILQRLACRYPNISLDWERGSKRGVVIDYNPVNHPREAALKLETALRREFSL